MNPPTGAWMAIKFANLIDPALATDIYAEKPWLYSPMLCSMNIVNVGKMELQVAPKRVASLDALPKSAKSSSDELSVNAALLKTEPSIDQIVGKWIWGNQVELQEDNQLLFEDFQSVPFDSSNIPERRKYFQNKKNRQQESFKTDRVYNLEVRLLLKDDLIYSRSLRHLLI
jgi:hypothetical protein